MDESSARILVEIAALWNRIEARAKRVEQFRGEAIVASINEMRYAGRRIVDVIVLENLGKSTDGDGATVRDNLNIARNYLINADHDLTDSVLFFVHRHIFRVLDRHGRAKVERLCPPFVKLYPEIKVAQEIVRGSREDRNKRSADYTRLAEDYVPKAIELHEALVSTKALDIDPQINWKLRIITILAVIGSLASLGGVALGIWGVRLAYRALAGN